MYPVEPQLAVGAVVINDGKILLAMRGKAPSQDLWAIPGGKVKLGESLQQAAEREIKEETGITIIAKDPIYTIDVIERDDNNRVRFHYVIVDLMAEFVDGNLNPGDDVKDARWFGPEEITALPVNQSTMDFLKNTLRFI